MSKCSSVRAQFSEYLDGALTGVAMQGVAAHLESCRKCSVEFERWRSAQRTRKSNGVRARCPWRALRGLRVRCAGNPVSHAD